MQKKTRKVNAATTDFDKGHWSGGLWSWVQEAYAVNWAGTDIIIQICMLDAVYVNVYTYVCVCVYVYVCVRVCVCVHVCESFSSHCTVK